jgi:hypothetical protein
MIEVDGNTQLNGIVGLAVCIGYLIYIYKTRKSEGSEK